jgi:hypothetical protein
MAQSLSSQTPRFKPIPPVVLLGLTLFLVAFFMPSVMNGSANGSASVPGYECAKVTLHAITGLSTAKNVAELWTGLVEFASGMMSFFTLAAFALRLLDGPSLFARTLAAIALLICLPSNIYTLIALGLLPIYGFYTWVLGTLLILFPEILALVRPLRP